MVTFYASQLGYYFQEKFTLILNMHILFQMFVFYRDFEFLALTLTQIKY